MGDNASSAMSLYVEINGERCPMELGQLYLFGKRLPTKKGDNKLVFNIDDEYVDEKHCCVEVSVGEDVFVFDLFSSCGTFVNGDRLKPLEKTCVKHGDVMKLGTLQSVRFFHEQLEMSHDSSGYGDNNKNTSDIIGSSPESTSQRDGRLKRFNSHNSDNFLVPAVPPPPKTMPRKSNSLIVPETEELATSRNSLGFNVSQNKSRNSDSFSIPETQYCGPRGSTASNLSLAESNPDEELNRSGLSFNTLGGNNNIDDDFCIPETQELVQRSEKPRFLKDNKAMNALTSLEEKSVDLNDSDDEDNNLLSGSGSQFRICTQDYNEGFGEEDDDSIMQSQVIPFIKHTTVLLNGSCVQKTPVKAPSLDMSPRELRQAAQKEDKEIANINWSADKTAEGEETKNLNCSTPDLFEFEALESGRVNKSNNNAENGETLFEQDPPTLGDDEDFMPTQIFPASNNSKPSAKDRSKPSKDKDIFSGKADDQFLTLSDKENMQPDTLEPITDLPPTQLFATYEAPSERSLASTSLRKSNLSKPEAKQNETTDVLLTPPTTNKESSAAHHVTGDDEDDMLTQDVFAMPTTINKKTSIVPHVTGDEEDDFLTQDVFTMPTTANKESSTVPPVMGDEEDAILTQAFVQPLANVKTASSKTSTHNYFNSTLLDDRAVDRNPASFFAELERTPKKGQAGADSLNVFKLPETEVFTSVKKTSSAASTTSTTTVCSEYSDMDLLMCTPQLIKEHMQYSKSDELKKHILAAKNKKLFGEDTDEGEDFEEDRKSKDRCLVELINVPKDSKDFDKLLPHLKHDNDDRLKRKSILTEEQKAAKEASKKYKFNISFGDVQDKDQKASSGKSSTLSRDERHAARDKEKAVADQKKKLERSLSDDKPQKSTRRAKQEETRTTNKPENKPTTTRKTRMGGEEDNEKDVADEKKKTTKKHARPSKEQENSIEKRNEQKESLTQPQKPNKSTSDAVKNADRTCKTSGEKSEETQPKKAKETVENNNSKQDRPTRRRTRLQSADKPKENAKVKSDELATKDPARRVTRLKSATEEKDKHSTNKDSIASSDDLDLIPTQPLIRNTRTRTRSRSSQKDTNVESDASSSVISHTSSNASRTRNRSSSRLSTSYSAGLIRESTANTTSATSSFSAAERKRKADIPMPLPVNERKRLKRTISVDSTNSTASSSTAPPPRRLISITMVDPERFNEINDKSKGLWAVAKDPADSEILVMDKSFRTFKFLLAMARGIPIVTSQWLKDLNEAKSLKRAPALSKYSLCDPAFEKKHKFCLEKSLQLARDNKKGVFHGYEFAMTSSIKPSPVEIKAIIEISGGIVHVKGPTAASKDNTKMFLVSSVDDRKDWHKYRRLNANIVIVNTEAIMSSVMRQNCTPLSSHILA